MQSATVWLVSAKMYNVWSKMCGGRLLYPLILLPTIKDCLWYMFYRLVNTFDLWIVDSFSITGSGGSGTPIICGANKVMYFSYGFYEFVSCICTSTAQNLVVLKVLNWLIIWHQLQGQHIFVDSNGNDCHVVNMNIGSTTATRSIDIMVSLIFKNFIYLKMFFLRILTKYLVFSISYFSIGYSV